MISLGPELPFELLQTRDRHVRRALITKQLSIQPDSIVESLLAMPTALVVRKNWPRIILDPETLERLGPLVAV